MESNTISHISIIKQLQSHILLSTNGRYVKEKTKFQNKVLLLIDYQNYLKNKLEDHKNACLYEGNESKFDHWLVIFNCLERVCINTSAVPLPDPQAQVAASPPPPGTRTDPQAQASASPPPLGTHTGPQAQAATSHPHQGTRTEPQHPGTALDPTDQHQIPDLLGQQQVPRDLVQEPTEDYIPTLHQQPGQV